MKNYKIYTLAHPITLEVVYVGQTSTGLNERLIRHYGSCLTRTSNVYKWIKELRDNKLIPIIELVEEVSEDLKNISEKYWISQLKEWGFNLLNQTDGGEGTSGYKHSKVSKQKMSENNVGRLGQIGVHFHSEESKLKMSKAKLGKTHSEETKEKIGIINKNKIGGNYTKVIDIETNIIYPSIAEAARVTGISNAALKERVRINQGNIIKLEESKFYTTEKIKIRNHKNKVIDTNTGIIYESGKEAARELNLNYNSLKKKIRQGLGNILKLEFNN